MKRNIAVMVGGLSHEYDIAIQSGKTVMQHLDASLYCCYEVYITADGWYALVDDIKIPIDKNDFSIIVNGHQIYFDAVFNTIHGTPGEDGLMASYFELLNIPQTSCDTYTAAITFNKRDLLAVLKPFGILSAPSYYLNTGDIVNTSDIISKIGLPCFVKANRSGSSFGVYKSHTEEELQNHITEAFQYDTELLLEAYLSGTEVSVGVVKMSDKIKVLPITEIVSENDFFDYEAKYQGKSQEITPARITAQQTKEISEIALKIYQCLKLRGITRSEFIFVDDVPYLLEINTTPGLSNQSIIPQQAKAAGISLSQLFHHLIQDSINSTTL